MPDHSLKFAYLIDRPQEVPLVIDWWRTVWADRMGSDIDLSIEQLSSSLGKTEFPIHILALDDDVPVGTAALKRQELPELFPDYHYWLGSVFVEEGSRGKDFASMLSIEISDIARSMGLPHLYLQTVSLDGGLYAKLGWKPLKEFTHMDEHALLMLKEL